MAYSGQKLAYYYDERNLESVKISTLGGEIWDKPAKLNLVGLQVGDTMEALADTRRREKQGIKAIEAIAVSGAVTIKQQHAALEQPMEHLLEEQSRLQESHKASTTNLFKDRKIKQTPIKRTQEIDPLEELLKQTHKLEQPEPIIEEESEFKQDIDKVFKQFGLK